MVQIITIYQGLMLILLYITLSARSIMLYKKDGINPFVLGKGKKGFDFILEILFLVGLLVWSYEIIAIVLKIDFHIIPIKTAYTIIFSNSIVQMTGILLISSGYVLFIFSLIAFGKSWRVGIDNKNPGKLITKGIYSHTRNPIFVYINFYFIGTALINTNLVFISYAIIALLGIHYQILNEEKFLVKQYGNEYSEYKKRARRYL